MTDNILTSLFLAHRRELLAYLVRVVRDPHTAADLLQETFLRFAEQPAEATVGNVRSYLYRTAHNLAVDYFRAQERRRTDITPHDELAHIAEDRPSPDVAADARRRLDALRRAVAELPPRTRAIFLLNRVEGLTYAAVARRLGVSESTVQKHLARALLYVTGRMKEGKARRKW